jgi:hypothetical protein
MRCHFSPEPAPGRRLFSKLLIDERDRRAREHLVRIGVQQTDQTAPGMDIE